MTELKLSTYYQDSRRSGDNGTIYPVPVDSVSENGVTGVLAVTFTEPTHAYVRTEGHVNDDLTILTYRGNEFLVSVHVYLKNGKWELGEYKTHTTRRDNWSDATQTQTRALEATVLAVMNTYADTSPEFIKARKSGTEYHARLDLDSAQRDVDKLKEQLKVANTKLTKAKRAHRDALREMPDGITEEAPAKNPFRTRGPQQ